MVAEPAFADRIGPIVRESGEGSWCRTTSQSRSLPARRCQVVRFLPALVVTPEEIDEAAGIWFDAVTAITT